MELLQYYYTSTDKGREGHVGFQCKAMSPGITEDDLTILKSMVAYQIPYDLDVHAVQDHPIAFRYNYIGGDKCYLVHSQSNGKDENGRPGNFFAHGIITAVEEFDTYNPILYWKHPFWKSQDKSDLLEIPPQPSFQQKNEPSLNFEKVFPFLNQGNRQEWFYKLLSAFINHDGTQRPIIILDNIDHIAHWIAAMTIALPKFLRKYITFSTYHHAPYQASYKIIGTTKGSSFKFSENEYLSYFILNAYDNRISDTPDSIAAKYISENLTSDLYIEKLIDLFYLCERRLPYSPTNLAVKLNSVVTMHIALREKDSSLPTDEINRSIVSFITELRGEKDLIQEDIDDLNIAVELLENDFSDNPTKNNFENYTKALHLLKQVDEGYLNHFERDFTLLFNLFPSVESTLIASYLKLIEEIYSAETLSAVLSKSDNLKLVVAKLINLEIKSHKRVWQYLMPKVTINTNTRPFISDLLQRTFTIIDHANSSHQILPSPSVEHLLNRIITVLRKNEKIIIENIILWATQSETRNYTWLYYLLVEPIPIEKRQPYRNQLMEVNPEIIYYEMERDILAAGKRNFINRINAWLTYGTLYEAQYENYYTAVLTMGLNVIWTIIEEKTQLDIALELLYSPLIDKHLDAQWKNELIVTYFKERSFQLLNQEEELKYEDLYKTGTLPTYVKAKIGGSLAMTRGQFSGRTPEEINKYLAKASDTVYEKGVLKLLDHFFNKKITLETHIDLLNSTYVEKYSETFFHVYWNNLYALMFDSRRTNEFIALLSFWFDKSFNVFEEKPYLAQCFFLNLHIFFEYAQKEKGYKSIINDIEGKANKLSWFPYISTYLEKKKLKLLGR